MYTFPLMQIPASNILAVMKKMNFHDISRMRQTCHEIDELIHRNSYNTRFFASASLVFAIYEDCSMYGMTHKMGLFIGFEKTSTEEKTRGNIFELPVSQEIECALFDSISLMMVNPVNNLTTDPFIQFIEQRTINSQKLIFSTGYIEGIDVLPLFEACGASSLEVKQRYPIEGNPPPLPFEIIRQLSARGCKEILLESTSLLEFDYVDVLSRLENVIIESIIQGSSPPVAPLLKKMITDPSVSLRSFRLPIYNATKFLSECEIHNLKSVALYLDMDYTNTFVLVTSTDYIMIGEILSGNDHSCACTRIAKDDIEGLAIEWFDYYVPKKIPYDASGLYELFANSSNNYGMIEDYMRFLLDNAASY